MKLKIFIFFLLLTTIIFPSKDFAGKWSAYQGWMNWQDAKKNCRTIGMRIPTRNEILIAHKKGLTESWKKDGAYYWTSEESPKSGVYVFGIFIGRSISARADKGKHTRCVR